MGAIGGPRATRSRGLSLVELMIGLALGLFLVAVAATLLAGQLGEQRRLQGEVRLLQDLRATADLMARDLRRAGYWGHAARGVWQPGGNAPTPGNPYATVPSAGPTSFLLRYSRDAVENDLVDANEQFGYRLRAGIVEVLLGADNWQALSDPATMTVTALAFTPSTQEIALGGSCALPCPAGAVDCPPRQRVQTVAFLLTARSKTEAAVVRSLRGEVRLRADAVLGRCPVS